MPHLVPPGGLPPTAEKAFLGVAVRYFPTADRLHIGFVYRKSAVDSPRLSHLEWHERLRDEQLPDGEYHWQACQIGSTLRPTVVAFLNFLRRTNPTPVVPYAFTGLGCKFELDARTKLVTFQFDPSQTTGLTCATYLDCVFQSLRIPFIESKTWPPDRPGDTEWRESIIRDLKRNSAHMAHATNLESASFDVRIRPEDVASAAIQSGWPVSFDRVADIANEIRTQLRGH